jgi:TolA-binding protein
MLNTYRLAVSDPKGGLAVVGDYYNYSDLARNGGSSGEAVRALQRGMQDKVVPDVGTNLQALKEAQAEVQADKRTLAAEVAAAEANAKGEVAVKVGLGLYSAGDYAKAAELVRKGIAKGGVARLDDANLLLGAALLADKRKAEARAAFEAAQAAAGAGPLASIARMWIAVASRDDAAAAQTAAPGG